jgi:hypothetical protein
MEMQGEYINLPRGNELWVTTLRFAYAATGDFQVGIEIPLVHADIDRPLEEGQQLIVAATSRNSGTGLGDIGFSAKYGFYEGKGLIQRAVIGAELFLNSGDAEDGTGLGTNQIAPFFGLMLSPRRIRSLLNVCLFQYFNSFGGEKGAPDKEIFAYRNLVIKRWSAGFWTLLDPIFQWNFENDDDFSVYAKLQAGRMFSKQVGLALEYGLEIEEEAGANYNVEFLLRYIY